MMPANPRRTLVILAALIFNVAFARAEGDPQAGAAKAATCSACHGQQGISLVPDFPSLAGQSVTYLYLQLRAFKDGSRANEVMRPLVQSLSDRDLKDLSAYYASLRPTQPATANFAGKTDTGRMIFTRGDAAHGVPPCQGCHGRTGRGPEAAATPASGAVSRPPTAWQTYPALAGQQAPYVVAQLKAYQSGARGQTTNARIMQGIARSLDESSMEQLAAYINQLAPE